MPLQEHNKPAAHMETLAQLEAWQKQSDANPGARGADIDVARRLIRHGISAAKEIIKLRQSRDFYMRRCQALQAVQSKMRDPERNAVCDILANGSTNAMNGENFVGSQHERT